MRPRRCSKRDGFHGGSTLITLGLDAADHPTHGAQQFTLLHGYCGQYQHFPLIISEPTTKYVLMACFRPGAVHSSLGAGDVKDLQGKPPALHIRLCHRCPAAHGTQGLLQRAIEQYQRTRHKARLFQCFQCQCDS